LVAVGEALAVLVLFMEHWPETVHTWLQARVAADGGAVAIERVDQQLECGGASDVRPSEILLWWSSTSESWGTSHSGSTESARWLTGTVASWVSLSAVG
jgi:hypothetical protein